MAIENTRKKVNNIKEIWDGSKLIIKDFSNLDLEGLDLSIIPEFEWNNCIINNTSFKNTGINIDFNFIHTNKIKNCDFSYNDLSNNNVVGVANIYFYSCDFRETNLWRDIYGEDNYLDKSFTKWSQIISYIFTIPPIDIKTLEKNPQLSIPSCDLFLIISTNVKRTTDEDCIKLIEEFLKYDKQGHLKKLYEILKKKLMDYELINLFQYRRVLMVNFDSIDFGDIDGKLLGLIKFNNCEFNDLTLRHNIADLLHISDETFNNTNKINNIITPNINYSDWQDKPSYSSRVSLTPATFKTNLYLELGRLCNAKCEFCRNSYYCDNAYDLDRITKTLHDVIPRLDSIVIGGGEPTLILKDLKKLLRDLDDRIHRYNVGLYLFTNGSYKDIDNQIYTRYNISRHAIDDLENAKIFGLNQDKIMSTPELERFIERTENTTLAATCFKGGLDSKEKIIDYIRYAISIGCESILFSDLIVMEDELLKTKENYSFNIESKVFEDVILHLQKQGFEKIVPIWGTGGYSLTMLKKGNINISFKHYISKNILEKNWPNAIKRTFDLSIDPSGDLYENWHQTSGLVKSIKYK